LAKGIQLIKTGVRLKDLQNKLHLQSSVFFLEALFHEIIKQSHIT